MELHLKYRPKSLDELVGQEGAVKALRELVKSRKVPHALLLTGPSGCGKTTVARILKKHLSCSDRDFIELNAASVRGIDMVRDIGRKVGMSVVGGGSRIWYVDEAHQLTGDAQDAFLKMLEEAPRHVYFILATTNAVKLKRTVRTRLTEVKVCPLRHEHLLELLRRVADKEGVEVTDAVLEKIADESDGSARMALVLLHQVSGLTGEDEMMSAVQAPDVEQDAIALANALLPFRRQRPKWSEIRDVLERLEGQDSESLRHLVLVVARKALLKGGPRQRSAAAVIEAFSGNFFDSKAAGLALACFDVYVAAGGK